MRARIWVRAGAVSAVATAMAMAGLAGCSAESEGRDDAQRSSEADPLYMKSIKIWATHQIQVCWAFAGYDTEKAWVQQVMLGQKSWLTAGNVSFVGWGTCPSSFTGIQLAMSSLHPNYETTYLAGSGTGLATIWLDLRADLVTNQNSVYPVCQSYSLTREQCIKTNMLHEFGHAVGIAHEQNRPAPGGLPAGCATAGNIGDQTFPSQLDLYSIMSYCPGNKELDQYDRMGLRRWYGQPNVDPPRLGDYNFDNRADLLCHDAITGTHWLDYGDATAQYGGTDWFFNGDWCRGPTQRVFKGDFNGDHHTDLLCHDISTGKKWIDLADSDGGLRGTNWSRSSAWCNGDADRLLIGDFDANGSDDFLCYSRSNGALAIQYGPSFTTEWSTSWLALNAKDALLVGDFDGNGSDDLLRYRYDAGVLSAFYATNGHFGPQPTWFSSAGFCGSENDELFVGYFDDGPRADLLCHNIVNGTRTVAYTSSSGLLASTWSSSADYWCTHAAARLYVGAVNADLRDDLLCYDVQTGQRWVDYASTLGRFESNDYSSFPDGWCAHDSGRVH